VAGQPVRPTQRAGKLLLPLERSGTDDTPIAVELTYVGADKFPKTKGKVSLLSPKLDVPLKNARWELYLPPEYAYTHFEGSMTHEARVEPVVQLFSSGEYFKQEEQKKIARQSSVSSFLSKSRRGLAEGKVKEANNELSQAIRLNADGDDATKKELEGLKRELGRVQSGNLIQAQRAYSADNLNRYNGGIQANAPVDAPAQQAAQAVEMIQYDAEAAEQQWTALQKAQEVSVAKVQPLRANLPTRGQRHAFSQVLQTEVNKAMTIAFVAKNAKEVGWFRPALYSVAGFLMLWIFVSAVSNRPPRSSQAQAA
jgi:hypothetical protein